MRRLRPPSARMRATSDPGGTGQATAPPTGAARRGCGAGVAGLVLLAATAAQAHEPSPGDHPCPDGTVGYVWEYPEGSALPPDAKPIEGGAVVPASGCLGTVTVRHPTAGPNSIPGEIEPVDPPGPPPAPSETPPSAPGRAPLTPIPARPLTAPAGRCADGTGWDFEQFLDNTPTEVRGYATFEGWTGAGTPGVSPFVDYVSANVNAKAAPVYGNAVSIDRIRPPGWSPIIDHVGGDYWRFSQDVNQSGRFWIGSFDRRYSFRQHPGEWRDNWGEEATGTLTSPSCKLQARYLSFRIGGSRAASQRVEVQVQGGDPAHYVGLRFDGGLGDVVGHATQKLPPVPAAPDFPPPSAAGPSQWVTVRAATNEDQTDNDWMQQHVFDLQRFVGRDVRIRIVDDHRGECVMWSYDTCIATRAEHVNADDFRFTREPPADVTWLEATPEGCPAGAGAGCTAHGLVAGGPPLWGGADVHAHPMANLAFGGHLFWGDATDALDDVYDCSRPLPAIPGPGGRDAVTDPTWRSSCHLHGEIVAIVTGTALAGCSLLAVVPFVGVELAVACSAGVTAAGVELASNPVIEGVVLHGGRRITSGAVKVGVMLSDALFGLVPDIEQFSPGLVPSVDAHGHPPAGEWWPEDQRWHSLTGMHRSHNAYQVDMLLRAHRGGLRLTVWDVVNSRALALIADGRAAPSDWQALKEGTDAAKRIVGSISHAAEIALSPDDVDRIIRAGKLAVILGSEVDELGRPRPLGLPWPRSPASGPDTMQKQVDDLWALGIRKISPVHATNNPIGGAALFTSKYDLNNYFLAATPLDGAPTMTDLTSSVLKLDGTFGELFRGVVLGEFTLLASPLGSAVHPWNPTGWFDFATAPAPADKIIGAYDLVNYRIGADETSHTSLKDGGAWRGPKDVMGANLFLPAQLKDGAGFLAGCDIEDMMLPQSVEGFGAAVDARYVSLDAHRNALGLHRTGAEDGEAFLRAALKKGMLIDVDHMSQNLRLDAYKVLGTFAREAGVPPCKGKKDFCGDYPVVGVHSKLRGLERDPSALEEFRDGYGYSGEDTRSESEIAHVAENGGAIAIFATGSTFVPPNTRNATTGARCHRDSDCAAWAGPGSPAQCVAAGGGERRCVRDAVPASMTGRDWPLPAEVANDCDSSSKTLAVKYLHALGVMKGRGVTFATDFNGLVRPLLPRFGRAMPQSPACGNQLRDRTTLAQANAAAGLPGWQQVMTHAQMDEFSGVWYADYAADSPVPSAPASWATPADKSRFKRVVARRSGDQREDRAPRAAVDDEVAFNDHGPDNHPALGHLYQEGNRVGAQMYPMFKWRGLSGSGGWDYNLDGLQHIGLYPDLMQDLRNVGVQWEQLGAMFHSAGDYVSTWRRATRIGSMHP